MVQKAWKFIIVLCVLEVVILQPPLKYEKRRRPWSMPVRLGGRSKSQNSKREREEAGLKYQSRGGGPCCLAPLKKVVS